jgi:hypothetical protein
VKLSKDDAERIADLAGWDHKAARALVGVPCAGFEFAGPGVAQVAEGCQAANAMQSTSQQAAARFRYLGIDG